MMKVKCNIEGITGLTKGNIYEVTTIGMIYSFINDMGKFSTAHHSHFTIIQDTPQIEVGSEWVWKEVNETLLVKCVGDTSVFYQWLSDKSEACDDVGSFLKSFKPKPKTVTMYFYKENGAYMATEIPLRTAIFTREIEL